MFSSLNMSVVTWQHLSRIVSSTWLPALETLPASTGTPPPHQVKTLFSLVNQSETILSSNWSIMNNTFFWFVNFEQNSLIGELEIRNNKWYTISSSVSTSQYHLSDQYYDICIRRASGKCSICFSPYIISTTTGTASSFGLSAGKINFTHEKDCS